MRTKALLLALFVGSSQAAPDGACTDIAGQLRPRVVADQAVRDGLPFPPTAASDQRMEIVDRANTRAAKRLLQRCGWPGSSRHGAEAGNMLWLLIQHADRAPAFQKSALASMSRAVDAGEASARDMAYLADRIDTAAGRPQRYGTQLRMQHCGVLEFFPLDRREDVEARRAKLGLPSLDIYQKNVAQQMGTPDCAAAK